MEFVLLDALGCPNRVSVCRKTLLVFLLFLKPDLFWLVPELLFMFPGGVDYIFFMRMSPL